MSQNTSVLGCLEKGCTTRGGRHLVFRKPVQRRAALDKAVRMCNTGPWHWGTGAMAQQVCVVLSAAEREQLAAIAADRNRPRKHIERAQIVLASADRRPVQQVREASASARPRRAGSMRWRTSSP